MVVPLTEIELQGRVDRSWVSSDEGGDLGFLNDGDLHAGSLGDFDDFLGGLTGLGI